MRKILSLCIIISFLSIKIFSQSCFGSRSKDLIQAGTVKINTNDLFRKTRQFFYQTQISYQIPKNGFQTVLSLASFNSFNTSFGLNFLIRGQRVQLTNFLGISVVVLQSRMLSNIQISYFVSSRSDIWAGSFNKRIFQFQQTSLDLVFFNQSSNSNSLVNTTVTQSLCEWVPNNNVNLNYTAFVFISSIITGVDKFRINLGNTVFDKVKGTITTSLINTSMRIQLIILSYIVINNPHSQFIYTFSRGLNNLESNIDYRFKGTTQILQGKIDNNKNSFISFQSKDLNCFGNCLSTCILKTQCQKTKSNVIFNKTCFICPINTKFDQRKKNCSIFCPINQENINQICQCKIGFVRVESQCVNRCKINQIWINNSCRCVKGYSKINGLCTKCPDNSQPNVNADTCFCQKGFKFDMSLIKCIPITCSQGFKFNLFSNSCISICKNNQIYNSKDNTCLCKQNFYKINSICSQCPPNQGYKQSSGSCVQCGLNQISQNSICKCRQGTNFINGVCNTCPFRTVYNPGTLSCQSTCGVNQILSGSVCVCAPGFNRINKVCGQCPSNTYYDQSLLKCSPMPFCPARSEWDSKSLTCRCVVNGQNLINNICQPCRANAGWNGTNCVCRSQFFLINNQCAKCPLNSVYSSTTKTCVCMRGYYQSQNGCQKCDSTCGSCSGPTSKNCIDCIDVSFKLINSQCTKSTPCLQGKFLKDKVCTNCSAFCKNCQNQDKCHSCIKGFTVQKAQITQTLSIQFCQQICGDGIKFQNQCDDGNKLDGDGCSSTCTVQSGWSCNGGSPNSKSTCMLGRETTQIIKKAAALDISRVLQGVTLTNLPNNLTEGGCPNCNQILKVSVIKAQIIPTIKIAYIPSTQFKFLVQLQFNGIFSIPPFVFTLKINQKYQKYFTKQEMAQIITVTIDPALLARRQEVRQLTFEEIQLSDQQLNYNQDDVNYLFRQ